MARVFLSHASLDKPAVRRIARALRAAGHDTWLDEEQLLVGESIPAAIERGLRDADFVVICLSKAAAERGWIEAERDAALVHQFRERRERILPVRLEEVAPPYLIAALVYVDLFPDDPAFTQGVAELTRSIDAHEARRDTGANGIGGIQALPSTKLIADKATAAKPAARRVAPPTPAYPNAEVQALSEQLEDARARKQALREAAIATDHVDREILQLRRQLREGGQLRAGDALGDSRYLLIRAVGRGGFAVVWEAFDRTEQRRVAIKVLHQHLAGDPQRRERFFRGARVMMDLQHPAVVRVYDSRGEDEVFCYCVMELVPGGNLRDAVLGKRIELGRRLPLLLQVADALADAHRKGLVHRDIKPANILLDEDGNAKLTDFDLVGAHDTTGGTRTGALGTVVYAAPECLDKPQDATAPTDVFGLGMTAIFCLVGAELPLSVLRGVESTIAGLSCSHGLNNVLRRAVAWEASDRFPDAAAFAVALEGVLACSDCDEPAIALSTRHLEQAASSWERMGRPRDLLWKRRQLAEAGALDRASLLPLEAAFLAATARSIRLRRMAGASIVAIVLIGAAVAVALELRTRTQRQFDATIDAQASAANGAQVAARQIAAERDIALRRAFGLFDAGRWAEGERAWTEVEALTTREEIQYRKAAEHIDRMLLLDPTREELRVRGSELTRERLERAERDHRRDLAAELASRLHTYGDSRRLAVLHEEARLELTVGPNGTQVWIERAGAARQLAGVAPLPSVTVPPGSLVLEFEAPGHVAARLPILLARGENLAVRVALPTIASAPSGMLYVPAGRFLFGDVESSKTRRPIFNTAPLHEVSTGDYFIGRYEVTFADWMAFLDALPSEERRNRSPTTNIEWSFAQRASVALDEIAPQRWRLSLTATVRTYTAEIGQRLHYAQRNVRADQDWMKFPVSGVSYDDALAFALWLDRTGRIPGARLCNEFEWERAARGADGRLFPSGNTVAPDDANIDVTYGREPLAFGPDEVGSHPNSRSPVGADDMAGNVWEWTRSVETPDVPVIRGGSWYQSEITARSVNRESSEPSLRSLHIGVRLCATPR